MPNMDKLKKQADKKRKAKHRDMPKDPKDLARAIFAYGLPKKKRKHAEIEETA